MFDLSKLLGRIVEKYGTGAAFAADVGLPESALSNRLNNRVSISSDEIILWSSPDKLDIPAEEIHVFFLTPKVR
jgi:hypothetical protein